MTRVIIILVVTILVIGGLGFLFRSNLTQLYMSYLLEPSESFTKTTPPAEPDYSQPDTWAALPTRVDNAGVLPNAAVSDIQASAPADVFFIHPTTYYSGNSWNQPLHDATANHITDTGVLRGQASVFNSCCKIYVPRYRQATLFSFLDQEGDGKRALELAYGESICVNPLSWQANDAYVEHSHNLGGVLFKGDGIEPPIPDMAIADGQCVNGQLQITSPAEGYSSKLLGPNSYHIFDYALFHMNIRQNAQARTATFIAQGTLAAGPQTGDAKPAGNAISATTK